MNAPRIQHSRQRAEKKAPPPEIGSASIAPEPGLDSGSNVASTEPGSAFTQHGATDRTLRKLQCSQIHTLHECELLALILRTTSQQGGDPLQQARLLWQHFGSLRELERCGLAEISAIPGMNVPKATAILAALALGRRLLETPLQRGQSLTSSQMVFEAYAPKLQGLEHETFWLLLLDQKNRVIKHLQIAQGSINRCPIAAQDVFAPALREKAVRLLLLHNHPSGNPEPSQDDRLLTQRLQQMAQLLGLEIIDHLIIGDPQYISFADRGWL